MTNQELQILKNKHDIIGNDPALNRALDIAVAVAPTDITVLVSGESGASCFGLVVEALQDKELDWLKEQLGLNSESKILCISTEGDTDKANYRSIVWDGAYHK